MYGSALAKCKKRVLIADDDIDFEEFVFDVVEEMGNNAKLQTLSSQFKEDYKHYRPDVIILDLSMPEIDDVTMVV
jgi:DNA-binding NtrC family response regulator